MFLNLRTLDIFTGNNFFHEKTAIADSNTFAFTPEGPWADSAQQCQLSCITNGY
jgi:hypothetical protein